MDQVQPKNASETIFSLHAGACSDDLQGRCIRTYHRSAMPTRSNGRSEIQSTNAYNSDNSRRFEIANCHHPKPYHSLVIARSGATKQSRAARTALDCFATLAMTVKTCFPAKVGIHLLYDELGTIWRWTPAFAGAQRLRYPARGCAF